LIKGLQEKLNMAVLIITHDLGIVANIADEVVVIYHGEIMEAGSVGDIFRRPSHPYLKGLMAAVPHFDMEPGERLKALREVHTRAGSILGAKSAASHSVNKGGHTLLSLGGVSKTFRTRRQSWFGKSEHTKIVAV